MPDQLFSIDGVSQTLSESLNPGNLRDIYSFSLATQSALSLTTNPNIKVQLLSGSSTIAEGPTINTTLNPGNYQIRAVLPQNTEIFWRENSGGTNLIWQLDGLSVSGTTAIASVGPPWLIEEAHDWDGDGDIDLLWREPTSGTVYLWTMENGTVFAGDLIATVPGWEISGLGDFNSDGHTDILWQEPISGVVALWYMDGVSIISGEVITTVPGWKIQDVADWNQDGHPDLLWQEATGTIALWYMQGSAISSYSVLATIGGSWQIEGATDFNNDGNLDLLWRDSFGSNVIWFMEGETLSSWDFLPLVGGTWDPVPYNLAPQPENYTIQMVVTPLGQVVEVTKVNDGAEPGTSGSFRISRTGDTTYQLPISYSLSGTATNGIDYAIASIIIPAGQSSIDVPVTILDDTITEPSETVILTLSPGSYEVGPNNTATLAIADDDIPTVPTLRIAATDPSAAEPGNSGSFRISRTGSSAQAITINLSVTGSATNGTDYSAIANTITIPAGQSGVNVPISVINDAIQEPTETVVVTLDPDPAYVLEQASATISILDDDTPITGDFAPNTPQTARDIGILKEEQVFIDRVDSLDKDDWYTFTLPMRAPFSLALTGLGVDLDVELYNSALTLIGFSDNSGTTPEAINKTLPAGTYYLWIYAVQGNQGSNYQLAVSASYAIA